MEKFAGVEQMLGYQRLRGPNVAPAHGLEQRGVFAVGFALYDGRPNLSRRYRSPRMCSVPIISKSFGRAAGS